MPNLPHEIRSSATEKAGSAIEPTDRELAAFLGIPEERVRRMTDGERKKYARLKYVSDELMAGRVPAGVHVDYPRRKR